MSPPRLLACALLALARGARATEVPVIDLTPLREGDAAARRDVAARIGAACRDIGFFAVVGHGVPQPTIDAAWRATA